MWLPVTYAPAAGRGGDSATTPVAVTVDNTIQQLTGSFNVTKAVVGAGQGRRLHAGDDSASRSPAPRRARPPPFALADGASFSVGRGAGRHVVHGHRADVPPPTAPAFGWDPVQFTVNGVAPAPGNSVTFVIPPAGDAACRSTSSTRSRRGSARSRSTKTVTGEIAGLVPARRRSRSRSTADAGQIYELAVPADGSATQDNIPVGSVCTATESAPTGGLVDASYALGRHPTYMPADATATVVSGRRRRSA